MPGCNVFISTSDDRAAYRALFNFLSDVGCMCAQLLMRLCPQASAAHGQRGRAAQMHGRNVSRHVADAVEVPEQQS
eukprot:365661-Chlamydomonas_euryale.AAC.63